LNKRCRIFHLQNLATTCERLSCLDFGVLLDRKAASRLRLRSANIPPLVQCRLIEPPVAAIWPTLEGRRFRQTANLISGSDLPERPLQVLSKDPPRESVDYQVVRHDQQLVAIRVHVKRRGAQQRPVLKV